MGLRRVLSMTQYEILSSFNFRKHVFLPSGVDSLSKHFKNGNRIGLNSFIPDINDKTTMIRCCPPSLRRVNYDCDNFLSRDAYKLRTELVSPVIY